MSKDRRSADVNHYETNHTSAINLCVPPKFNHHYKQQWLASQLVLYETFRYVCEKFTTNFYKTAKSDEKDYSTELYIT